ncbi:MAG: hypothetical protein QM758_20855 [Armatimonas sp.]
MNRLSSFLTLAAACVALAGCGPKEPQEPPAPVQSVSEIDAKIKEIEANTHMPASAKGMAIGSLQKQRAIAAKREGGK